MPEGWVRGRRWPHGGWWGQRSHAIRQPPCMAQSLGPPRRGRGVAPIRSAVEPHGWAEEALPLPIGGGDHGALLDTEGNPQIAAIQSEEKLGTEEGVRGGARG